MGKRKAFAACSVVLLLKRLIRLKSVDRWLCRKAEYGLGFSFAGRIVKMSCSCGFLGGSGDCA